MVTIDRLRSALNARDRGISQNRGTRATAQGKLNATSSPVEGYIDPNHDTGGKPPGVDAFQYDSLLPHDQTSSGSAILLHSPSFQDDGQDRKDHAVLLLQAMASKSDSESTALLARLRMGHDWRKLAYDMLNNQIILGADAR
jgi:hypothetical protein